jgi:hypothetical protein
MTTPNDGAEPSLASAGSQPVAIMSREQADQIIQDQRAEIARLRVNLRLADAGFTFGSPTLTDEERALLVRLGSDIREWDKYSSGRPWFVTVKDAAIIRGILERLG